MQREKLLVFLAYDIPFISVEYLSVWGRVSCCIHMKIQFVNTAGGLFSLQGAQQL